MIKGHFRLEHARRKLFMSRLKKLCDVVPHLRRASEALLELRIYSGMARLDLVPIFETETSYNRDLRDPVSRRRILRLLLFFCHFAPCV